MIELLHMDCVTYMRGCEDNAFDLAIVDPPYFSGPDKPGYYNGLGQGGGKAIAKSKEYSAPNWEIPKKEYFDELVRVSKNQIIWGINYFDVSMPGGRVIWVKAKGGTPFSQAEIAYQSFYNKIEVFDCLWSGFWKDAKTKGEQRIHPTQKPVALYDWLLDKFAKPGQRILDTHGGSMSSAIACHYFGCDMVLCEKDKDYYDAACERFNGETKQLDLLA